MKAFTNSTLESYIHFSNYKLIINYNVLDKLINVIYRNKGTILDRIFADKVIVHISLPTKAEKIIREEFKMINMSLIN
jgi:putative IMPACT (imprinted ancient) family translation regulator